MLQVMFTSTLMAGIIAGILFGSAGRVDFPLWWVYLGLCILFPPITFMRIDRGLWKERMHPGAGSKDNLPLLRLFAGVVFVAHFVIAGLDRGRFHWSGEIPLGVQIAGLLGFVLALGLFLWAMTSNPFFSSAMRIQHDRGHRVITSGPYRYIRHPGYTAFILTMLFSGLTLGSWWSLVPVLGWALLFIRRAAKEDRLLQNELEGYREYTLSVRHRLVPGLW